MTLPCLIQFAQVHEQFRLPELRSIAELNGIQLDIPEEVDVKRPFMIINLSSEDDAKILAARCILIKNVLELWGHGESYEVLHERNKENMPLWQRYATDTTFKFLVTAYNHSIHKARQKSIMETFDYMAWEGRIDLASPEVTLLCTEEYRDRGNSHTRAKHEGEGSFRQVYFGRLLAEGTARDLIQKFDVKQRAYYGNTSMESEISLLMANQALSAPGRLIYDPFVGTGSTLYTCAQFGSYVCGSDIDGRQMRGKDVTPGIMRSAAQYGVASLILDLFTFDVTRHPWRSGGIFDAIITDPPC
ncbi:hypothetical protein SISSUDRAFT_1041460 [Sistotremastrum suecicum HHB10207 ss-3]|uniref:tRNA (guanine(10)-N(2))-methyltransferase TRMT11 N-terminal domain-containing protein n=1 Tax=Sistotremastrum suecicum HHB10207 ss-3 TaxID=1314776 RepID=A0A166HA70_9AGAM|nr:hypothetical protein SISSUDRAFT_1041460 [Sistotremastrum suecicum HHB10207 ss-3]